MNETGNNNKDDPPNGPIFEGELSQDNFGASVPSKRAAPRVEVAMDAGLRKSGGSAIPIRLMDLSTHGFRTETHLYLDPGDIVWVRLPGLESMPAIVKWAKGSLVGCAFERPLHPAVLDRIVSG
jgi:hypothetical protein